MIVPHPAEVEAMYARIERLERECQRLREIISRKADSEAQLLRVNRALRKQNDSLRIFGWRR